jgi:hypothetical protein
MYTKGVPGDINIYAMKDVNTTQDLSYYQKNKEKCRQVALQSYYKNREKRKEYMSFYNKVNRKKINERDRERREIDKEQTLKLYKQARVRRKERFQNDIQYKLSVNLRVRFYQSIKKIKDKKNLNALTLAGCTLHKIREHIEKQWLPGMSWSNYTKDGWHIDHIKPVDTFDLTDIEQQKLCFHYSNLRPLWATDNLSRPKDGSDI